MPASMPRASERATPGLRPGPLRKGRLQVGTVRVLRAWAGIIPLRGRVIRAARQRRGDVAQLGERCNRTAEVVGSNPIISTKFK